MNVPRCRHVKTGLLMASVAAVLAFPVSAAGPKAPLEIQPTLKGLQRPPDVPSAPADLFKLLDANGDGVIDRAEWRQQKMFVFFLRDSNRDMQLSRDELPGISAEIFDAADADDDGYISGYEFNQADFTQFEEVDVDAAGTVTYDEFIAYLGRLKATK